MRAQRACAYDGCRNALEYFQHTVKEFNGRHYCSHSCLELQYKSLSYDGAVHLVHQKFGPKHPVTEQIQIMRHELAWYKKKLDIDDRKYIGRMKRLGVYETSSDSAASCDAKGSESSK